MIPKWGDNMECCHNCRERNRSCHAFCEDYKKERFVHNILNLFTKHKKDVEYAEKQRRRKSKWR